MDRNSEVFFALVRAGLWADVQSKDLGIYGFQDSVDWDIINQLAEEQSVLGLVLAGLEHSPVKPPQELLLQWIGEVQILEQQNHAMNKFIATLVKDMRKAGIYTLLVKGQAIAQCYEKPLLRNCGDIDLFLSESDYESAKKHLVPLAATVEPEGEYKKHLGITIDSWVVELHGSLRCGLSAKMDKGIDAIQKAVFYGGDVRSWMNEKTQVFLPGADSDALLVFTHFIKHFYNGGLGLRQVCDWCRLLWTFRESLNQGLLEKRIRKMELMSEWKAFGSFAVDYLGMPAESVPFYSPSRKWKRKATRICKFVMEVGNMGRNRDSSYFDKPYLVRKIYSFGRRCGDLMRHARIFPMDSLRFFPSIVIQGVKSAAKGV